MTVATGMSLARFALLAIALSLVSARVEAQTMPPPNGSAPNSGIPPVMQPAPYPPQPAAQPAPAPVQAAPAPGPQAPAAPSAPIAPQQPYPQAYPQQGYPTAPPVYYAPGYAPAYGQQPPPPDYGYGVEPPPSDYARPAYQAMQGRKPGPGSHEHEGFYLHMGTGIGAGGASYKEYIDGAKQSVRTRGIALTFDIGIGGRVMDNFILHGNFTVTGFDVGKRTIDGVEDNGFNDITSALITVGVGGSYYFMPTNLYLTLVLGTGAYTETRDYSAFDEDQEDYNSKAGFSSALAIGKEWWVGGRGEWGIGAAIKGAVMVAPIEILNVKSTLVANAVTLEFSATLN